MVTHIPTLIHNGTTNITPTFSDPVTTYLVGPGVTPQGGVYKGGVFSYNTETDTVNADVIGRGIYNVNNGGVLEFLHSVGPGQKVELNGGLSPVELRLDDPAEFRGHVDMNEFVPTNGGPFLKTPPGYQQISIAMSEVGRAIDSYSYKNDMLSLWSGKHVVQTLSLTTNDPYGITVQNAPGGWVFVSANDRSNHGISFLNIPASQWTPLPVHHT